VIQNFINIYKRLLQSIKYDNYRYIYQDFNIQNKLTGLIGPRGTGKTTLLLQYINEKIENKDKCIYVTLDHIYFANTLLTDFVNELYEVYGIKIFFFDEIHKYPNWNQELKNIYDSYPDIKIIFSGSSSIDLIKGSYDLSRRGVLYRLEGLSFREYLIFKKIANIEPIKLDNLLEDKSKYEKEINKIEKIRGYFKNYLQKGYYPYIFENENVYYEKLLSIIEKIIFEDISNFYRLKTENLYYFKKILAYISSIPPGELNYNNIAKTIGLDNKTIHTYINILNETGLVELVRSNKTGSNLLKQKEKIYLNNIDVYGAITKEIGIQPQIGSIREIFFIKMIKNANYKIFYSDIGDFEVNGSYFEIGGKNKSINQIKNYLDKSFLVKDDIMFGSKYEIPLYLFGFIY
jgi:uncharacterized protein